jgi:YcxB-like protein
MQPQNQVTVDVTLEPSDFYEPFNLRRSSRFRLACGVVACLLAFTAWRLWPSDDSNFILIFVAVLACIFVYPWIKIQNTFRQSPGLRKPRRYSFNVDGMHLESEDARGDFKWSLFNEVVETKRCFLFMQTDRGGTPIPKRCLSQPHSLLSLRTLIRENFKGKRRLRVD